MAAKKDIVTVEVIAGVEGPSVYIDDTRVCGNKPWGGGRVQHQWKARRADILEALGMMKGESNDS